MNKKAETVRDRRVSLEEEKRLLDAALGEMNTARHMYVGEMLHDRIIGALEPTARPLDPVAGAWQRAEG